jgi:hypothetical protein
MVLVMAAPMVAMVEDTPHNPTYLMYRGSPNATVWVRAALPSELGPVSLAECFSQTPSTITETPATTKVCSTCFYSLFIPVVNVLLTRL